MTWKNRRLIAACVALALTSKLFAAEAVVAEHSVSLKYGDFTVTLSAASQQAFRLSVRTDDKTSPLSSIFVLPDIEKAMVGEVVHDGNRVGIKNDSGKVLIDPEKGTWTLADANGKTLVPETEFGSAMQKDAKTGSFVPVAINRPAGSSEALYCAGNGQHSLVQTAGRSRVGNGVAVIPYFWSPIGFSAFGVSDNDRTPVRWIVNDGQLSFQAPGSSADIYLMPAADMIAGCKQYASLTGSAPIPPRWTFGYMQSRWGWQDKAYIDDTRKQFEDRKLPIDCFIFDFEWYTPYPDYGVKPAGQADFKDFSFNPKLFPDPKNQLDEMHAAGIKMVGIRKPRMGNSETLKMLRDKTWVMNLSKDFSARDINYMDPELRTWYADQTKPLLDAGVDGWWDDEGELTYTHYTGWNMAQDEAQKKYRPNTRLWTICRAFQPGLQRLGAASWTGDINANWKSFLNTPTDLLSWGLAGQAYGACDIGGFNGTDTPELLTRWMQAGVFFPIMRTHSEVSVKPHFPWLYGEAAEYAMKQALELRYRLIPLYYSLADEARTGVPIMRPLVMNFPNDPQVQNTSNEWMIGTGLLAAPMITQGVVREVYLPDDTWYQFDTNTKFTGKQTMNVDADLDQIPVYVKAGTILPLASPMLHTSQWPNGPLQLQVYPGHNATFTLYEDDGQSLDYQKGQFRRTTFMWNDKAQELSWKREGAYAGGDVFKQMKITVFSGDALKSAEAELIESGSHKF